MAQYLENSSPISGSLIFVHPTELHTWGNYYEPEEGEGGGGGEGERGCCIWLVQYYVIQWATAFLELHSMVQDYMIPWGVRGAQGTNTVFQYFPRLLTKSWISSVLFEFLQTFTPDLRKTVY